MAFVWELTKETIDLPLGCLQGGLAREPNTPLYPAHIACTPQAIQSGEIGILLPNNQRQHRTLHIQKDVLPYVLC